MTKRLPKRVPDGAQNGPKSNPKFTTNYVGFLEPLGSVLSLSWVVWGSFLSLKILKNHWFSLGFHENHVFEEDKAWKGILDGTWADFDAKKGPKRLPNRTQNGAKMASKINQQIRSISDRS